MIRDEVRELEVERVQNIVSKIRKYVDLTLSVLFILCVVLGYYGITKMFPMRV